VATRGGCEMVGVEVRATGRSDTCRGTDAWPGTHASPSPPPSIHRAQVGDEADVLEQGGGQGSASPTLPPPKSEGIADDVLADDDDVRQDKELKGDEQHKRDKEERQTRSAGSAPKRQAEPQRLLSGGGSGSRGFVAVTGRLELRQSGDFLSFLQEVGGQEAVDLSKPLNHGSGVMVVGLHTCGDLGVFC
jgi:hypothetical protein